jgi:hypothetical protein
MLCFVCSLQLRSVPIVAHFPATEEEGSSDDWTLPEHIGIRESIEAEEVARFVEQQIGAS